MLIQRRKPCSSEAITQDSHPLLDKILRQRGISDASELSTQAQDLLHYKHLKGIDAASSLLADAVEAEQKICIVGDFDADGATSTALCILALAEMGYSNVFYIVPNRFDYGYGLTSPVVDLAHQDGAEVIITVDNGISSIEGVKHANSLGLKVIVTDHHLPAEEVPDAQAIVNPNQFGCQFPSKHIAGVGVAFYVMSALKNELQNRGYFVKKQLKAPNMANFLDIVAIGTVADVVTLDKNNRILVHQGIARIRAGKTRAGVLAILNIANRDYRKLCTSDIGFVIGPRLNAAGRLEDMSYGIECLMCTNASAAAQYAADLDALNQSRREIEQSMRDDAEAALKQIQVDKHNMPASLVLYREDFHQGVVGIVAGRLKEAYYRPTIIFANEDEHFIKGSARSIDGIHIRDMLARIDALQPNLIKKFGGHAMAAGLSIAKHDLPQFQTLLNQVVSEASQGLPNEAIIYSDGELLSEQINLELASTLKFALPWGQKFEEPQFDGEFEIVNQRIVGQKHLKLTVASNKQYFDAIAFNVDVKSWPNNSAKRIRLAYKLDINEFRGQTSVQLMVNSIELVE